MGCEFALWKEPEEKNVQVTEAMMGKETFL